MKIGNRTVIRVKHPVGKGVGPFFGPIALWQYKFFIRSKIVKIRLYAESFDGKFIYVTTPRIFKYL